MTTFFIAANESYVSMDLGRAARERFGGRGEGRDKIAEDGGGGGRRVNKPSKKIACCFFIGPAIIKGKAKLDLCTEDIV